MSKPVRIGLEGQLHFARQVADRLTKDSEKVVMASIVANLEFQLKYAEAFRRLARELIAAEQSPEAAAVRDEFPGTTIADVRDT